MATRGLSELEAVLGYHFAQAEALEQALTHASLRHEQKTNGTKGETADQVDNERMEFLGDAIVGMVVAELLYRRFADLDEGDLTRLRAALVSRRHLGQVGMQMDLGAYLRLGKAEERSGGRRKAVLLANCVETLIAALYLEGGLEIAAACVSRLVVEPYVSSLREELETRRSIGDYKTALQELLQARHAAQPEYALKAESGPDHRKRFVVEVRVKLGGAAATSAHGEASTKKRAEQEAARKAFERLIHSVPLQDGLKSARRPDRSGENGRTQTPSENGSKDDRIEGETGLPAVAERPANQGRTRPRAGGEVEQEQQLEGSPAAESAT